MTLSKCTVNVLVVFFCLFVCELLAGHKRHFVNVLVVVFCLFV